jgi:hypothetical protein
MANVQDLVNKVFARALTLPRNFQALVGVVKSSFEYELSSVGDAIDVEASYPIGVQDVTPAVTSPQAPARVAKTRKLLVDKHRQSVPFDLTHQQMTQIDSNLKYVPSNLNAAIDALAGDMNALCWSQYKYGYTYFGDPTLQAFESAQYGALWASVPYSRLEDNGIPRGATGEMLLDATSIALAKGIGTFQADATGDASSVMRQNSLGTFSGLRFWVDQQSPIHVAGTAIDDGSLGGGGGTGYQLQTQSNNDILTGTPLAPNVQKNHIDEVDTQVVYLSIATAGTGTLVPGDLITFAGHDQTYVVREANDPLTQSDVAVTISPPLRVPVDGSGSAVNVTPVMTHQVGLAIHPDAIAFANRAVELGSASEGNYTRSTMQDPQSGVVQRLTREAQSFQTAWYTDALFGAIAWHPEWICRIVHNGGTVAP